MVWKLLGVGQNFTQTHTHTHTYRNTHRAPFTSLVFLRKSRNIIKNRFNNLWIHIVFHHHHHSVLPKSRLFVASAGTWAAVLPKTGLPLKTQEPRLQFFQGLNRFGSFPLLSAPHSLFSIWIDFKDLKRSQGHQHGSEGSEFG